MESGTRLLCLILLVCFKGEREGGAVFVRSPSSIEYRYSLSPSPSSVFLLSFLFLSKIVSDLCSFFASPRMPSSYFQFFFSLLASPLDSLIAPRKETPLVVPNPYRIAPYRTILQYVFSSV